MELIISLVFGVGLLLFWYLFIKAHMKGRPFTLKITILTFLLVLFTVFSFASLVAIINTILFNYNTSDLIFGIVFTILFGALPVYTIVKLTTWKREEATQLARLKVERKKRLQEIKEAGFVPTKEYKGSGRALYLDENNKTWFVINNFLNPAEAQVFAYGDIQDVQRIENKEQAIAGGGYMFRSGIMINSFDVNSYYTRLGVMVHLKSLDTPTVFVNCIDDVDDVDRILSIFNNIRTA